MPRLSHRLISTTSPTACATLALACALLSFTSGADDRTPAKPSFTDSEIRAILSHGPWPAPAPLDATNRVSGKHEAIDFGTKLFFDERLSGPQDHKAQGFEGIVDDRDVGDPSPAAGMADRRSRIELKRGDGELARLDFLGMRPTEFKSKGRNRGGQSRGQKLTTIHRHGDTDEKPEVRIGDDGGVGALSTG